MTDLISANGGHRGHNGNGGGLPAETKSFILNPDIAAMPTDGQLAHMETSVGTSIGSGERELYLSCRNSQFWLKSGGVSSPVLDEEGKPARAFYCVVGNVAPDCHCVWWEEAFDQKQTVFKPPTATWWYNGQAPANVPEHVLKEKKPGGTNYYQIKQRLILYRAFPGTDGSIDVDTKKTIVFDIPASSIFGSFQDGYLSFIQYKRTLEEHRIFPCHTYTAITLDKQSTVPVPVFQFFMTKERKPLLVRPASVQKEIYDRAFDNPHVRKLLAVVPDPETVREAGAAAPRTEPKPEAKPAPKEEVAEAPPEEPAKKAPAKAAAKAPARSRAKAEPKPAGTPLFPTGTGDAADEDEDEDLKKALAAVAELRAKKAAKAAEAEPVTEEAAEPVTEEAAEPVTEEAAEPVTEEAAEAEPVAEEADEQAFYLSGGVNGTVADSGVAAKLLDVLARSKGAGK
ncbi:MAG: hypothetical protein LBT40_02400 [Deltaproteobacteria bacterium]|jgi:hypothetical protein|nr:hypothetical protein [Deltaproteobacteria bacterium]